MSSSRALFDAERDGFLYGLMRLLLGVLLFAQTFRITKESLRDGYFGNFFHLPLLPPSWVPSEPVYYALLGVEFVGALLAVVGYWGRAGLFAGSLAGLYVLFCDRLHYHNNRFALFLIALLCVFTPCDRSFLLYRGRRHALDEPARRGSIWAVRLIQFQVSAIYLASSAGKLFDPDWRGGIAMHQRVQMGYLTRPDSLAPPWVLELVSAPWFIGLLSKAAIGTELFLAFGLWFPRTRVVALWVGVAFHVGIELGARVQLFSWLMGAAYLAFVTPELRERELRFDAATPLGRAAARLGPWLDWLARFRFVPSADLPVPTGLSVLERDGGTRSGFQALPAFTRAIPLLFPLWPLLWLVAWLRSRPSRAS